MECLPHDGIAAIGSYLEPTSLAQLAATCTSLHSSVGSNQQLWSAQAAARFPSAQAWGTVLDWPCAYRAAHLAACQLRTQQPWTVTLDSRALPSGKAPWTARVLALHSSSSSSSSSSGCAHAWQPPDVIAASFDEHLHWWRDSSSAGPAAAPAGGPTHSKGGCSSSGGGSDGAQLHHCRSDPQQGHTAFIDELIALPSAAGTTMGFASGARDRTIKLWTPFTGSSSSSTAGPSVVRPTRTLRGHTGSVNTLLCLPTPQAGTTAGDGGAAQRPALLASGSTDKTIKLWSLTLGGSSSGGGGGGGGAARQQSSQQQRLQQGRNPLLATLRGHSCGVTGLLPWPWGPPTQSSSNGDTDGSDGSSGPSMLLSGSKDYRVKLWHLDEGRQGSAAATWHLPGSCMQLLSGLSWPGCVVAVLENVIQVLDLRMPGGSSSSSGTFGLPGGNSRACVIQVPWPSNGIAVAAAHGTTLAASGRRGLVRAWDLRQHHGSRSGHTTTGGSSNSTASGSASASLKVLFSGRMPHGEPVVELHLDRVKLVAATRRVVLHSRGSIVVWRLPEGGSGPRLHQLSSTLDAIDLNMPLDVVPAAAGAGAGAGVAAGAGDQAQAPPTAAGGRSSRVAEAWALLSHMHGTDGDEALAMLDAQELHPHHHAAALQPQQQALFLQQLQQAQAQQPQPVMPAWPPLSAQYFDSDSDLVGSESTASGDSEASSLSGGGSDDGAPGTSGGWWCHRSSSSSSSIAGVCDAYGRIEPGVLTMHVCGDAIACIDTLGQVLVRDFTRGAPTMRRLAPFVAAAASGSAEGGGPSAAQQLESPQGAAGPGSGAGMTAAAASAGDGSTAAATADLSINLRFWKV